MKKLGMILLLTVLLVAGVMAYLLNNAGDLIKDAIESLGPDYLGASVTVDNINLSLTDGLCEIEGLKIGNPEGFSGDYAFQMKRISVTLDTDSIGQDVIVLKQVDISGASLHTIVNDNSDTNLQQLMKNLDAGMGAPEQSQAESEIKLIVEKLAFVGASAIVTSSLLGESTVEIPDIYLADMGRKSNGATAVELLQQLLKPITDSVVRELAKQKLGVENVEEAVKDKVKDVKSKLKSSFGDKLKSLGHPSSK